MTSYLDGTCIVCDSYLLAKENEDNTITHFCPTCTRRRVNMSYGEIQPKFIHILRRWMKDDANKLED